MMSYDKSIKDPLRSDDFIDYTSIIEAFHALQALKCHIAHCRLVLVVTTLWKCIIQKPRLTDKVKEVRVTLDRSSSGNIIRRHILRRRYLPKNYRVMTVLELPLDYKQFIRSRSRQALRTNLRKAERFQLSCKRVRADVLSVHIDRLRESESDIKHLDLLSKSCSTGEGVFWMCTKPDGEETGLALFYMSGDTALLGYLCTSERSKESYTRWALSAAIIEALISDNIRFLITDFVIDVNLGNAYFQRRLGFYPTHVSVAMARATGNPAAGSVPEPNQNQSATTVAGATAKA